MKVSIIVPIYNVEKYLDRCMESLLNQTLKDIEIIMVDDGSPDRCPQMCDEYARKDSRVKVIHKENAGLGYARNSGLEVATGEYVAFVDSDDFVDTKMYEKLYFKAKEHSLDAIFCGFRKEFSPNRFLSVSECSEYKEYSGKDMNGLTLDFISAPPYHKEEYIHDMSVWHSVYKRDLIEKHSIRFVSEREYASEDIPFQIDFLKHSTKVGFIPDVFYHYCYNQGSLTKSFNIEKFEKVKALYRLLSQKEQAYETNALRSKRLFIGYVRAMIRLIVSLNIPKKEKLENLHVIFCDGLWNEMRSSYKPSYLPMHQRIMSLLIYKNKPTLAYVYACFMNFRLLTYIKQLGGNFFAFLLWGCLLVAEFLFPSIR